MLKLRHRRVVGIGQATEDRQVMGDRWVRGEVEGRVGRLVAAGVVLLCRSGVFLHGVVFRIAIGEVKFFQAG